MLRMRVRFLHRLPDSLSDGTVDIVGLKPAASNSVLVRIQSEAPNLYYNSTTPTESVSRHLTRMIIMALRNNENTANINAAFESEDETAATTAPAATAAPAATTAVATQTTRAVSTAKAVVTQNVLSDKKDAFYVEFDSMPRLAAEQGSFTVKDSSEADLGPEIKMELMSYQESWVASPNDKKADVELVKYSDDGIESKDGVNLQQHIADLKEQGYDKAKIAHRCIIVGELLSAGPAGADLVGNLIQVDLPETGRRSFNAYALQASWAVGKGRKTAAEAAVLTLKAVKEKSRNNEVYTKIVIS